MQAQQRRIDLGLDPDEHTIWNVLCPQIRAKWSPQEERNRRTGLRFSDRDHVELKQYESRHIDNHTEFVPTEA